MSIRLAKEDVVIGVGIKRRIEINKIDARVRKFFPGPKASAGYRQSIADSFKSTPGRFDSFVARLSRSYTRYATVHVARPHSLHSRLSQIWK